MYDAGIRDFYHFNRAYASYRKVYNTKVSEHKDSDPIFDSSHLEALDGIGDSVFEDFCQQVGRGKLKFFPGKDRVVHGVFRETETKQGETPQEVEGYFRAPFMGVSCSTVADKCLPEG